MVVKKIKIKRIENATARQVTFSKRRGGLLKKAHDLAVMCDAEVGVIIFSGKGKLFQFASPSMQCVLDRYSKNGGDSVSPDNLILLDNGEMDRLTQFTQRLNTLQSNLIGDDLERLSLSDVIHLEQQINGNLRQICAKKDELLLEKLEDFQQKVTETWRTTNANAKTVEKPGVFFSSLQVTGFVDSGGQGDCERHCPTEAPQTDALLDVRAETSEQSNYTPEGCPAAMRFRILDDLNHPPICTED